MNTFEQWEQFLAEILQAEMEILTQLDVETARDILRHTGLIDSEDYPFEVKFQLECLSFLRDSVEVVFRPQGLFTRQLQRRVTFPINASISDYISGFVKSAVKIHPKVAFLTAGDDVPQKVREELEELERLVKKYPKRVQMWMGRE